MKLPLVMLLTSCLSFQEATQHGLWLTSQGDPIVWKSIPITWTFAYMFPEELKPAFKDGFGYWNTRLGVQVFKELECEDVCLIQSPQVVVFEGVELKQGKAFASTLHELNSDGTARSAIVRFMPLFRKTTPDAQKTAARHEAGHVLGLNHNDEEICLMYPSMTRDEKLKDSCNFELDLVRQAYIR